MTASMRGVVPSAAMRGVTWLGLGLGLAMRGVTCARKRKVLSSGKKEARGCGGLRGQRENGETEEGIRAYLLADD